MSRRPGIGKAYAEKYREEILLNDSVIVNGREVKPPKYYVDGYEIQEPEKVAELKKARKEKSRHWFDELPELPARQKIAESGVAVYSEKKL